MKAQAQVNLTEAADESRATRVDAFPRKAGLAVRANQSKLKE